MKYQLAEPVKFGSQTVTEFEIRKPKAKDFRRMPAGEPSMGAILDLVGQLSGQPTQVIDELCVEDMTNLAELVGSFMQAGPATGTGR